MAEWLPVRLYRFHHDHGGAKDWAVAHDSQTVRIYYGKTDSVLRTTTIPRTCCREDSPAAEARARERRKVAAGYTDLGDYALNLDNRRQLRPLTEPPEAADEDVPTPPSATPSVFYSARELLAGKGTLDGDWFF